MSENIEADWMELLEFGSDYEQEMDINASPSAPAGLRYRHRLRRFSGQPAAQWRPGLQGGGTRT